MEQAGVSVQILGPVRAWRHGQPAAVRGLSGRSVLAKLALAHRSGGPATIDSLIDALWDDDPPKDPAANVQTIVSRLRRSLGPEAIETAGHGYRLTEWVATDVAQLERALRAAGTSSDPGPLADELHRLVSGLGPDPLPDVAPTVAFEPDRAVLRELRVRALDRLAEVQLAAGRPEEAATTLAGRIHTEPVRETTHLLAARAMAATGRSADALRVLARYRTALVELSGLTASDTVQELEQAILDGEPIDTAPRANTGGGTDGTGPPAAHHNLPVPASTLIGRITEIDEIGRLVRDHPLTTLTGTGGSGKTRLALAVASAVGEGFADGVVFVDLSVVAEGPIADAVVDAGEFRVAEGPGDDPNGAPADPVEVVARFVARRELLLVLDNCEHVLDAAASFAATVQAAHPSATMLATSREPLGLDGERVFRVDPLATDDADSDAVTLLVERTKALDRDFDLREPADRRRAVELCRRLDGLPLAIELAAARLTSIGLAELLERIDERLDLLAGRRHHAGRQQTLHALVDWSWELLDDDSRRLLAALSVFTGSFGLDGVEAVCSDHLTERPLHALRRLVDASLVEVQRRGGSVRYRLLDTIRLFARRRLAEDGLVDELHRRHRDWLIDRVTQVSIGQQSLSADWIGAYTEELDNVFAAIEWSIAHDEVEEAARLLAAGAGTWRRGHRSTRVVDLADRLLSGDLAEPVRTYLLMAASDAALAAGRFDSMIRWSIEAREGAARIGDADAYSLATVWRGIQFLLTDTQRCLALYEEGEAVAESVLVRAWATHSLIYGRHVNRLGEPMDIDPVENGPRDCVARGGLRELATINDAFGGRLDDARRHLDWFAVHGDRLSPVREIVHVLPVMVEALAGDPADAIAMAPEAAGRMWRTTETVGRHELLLAIAIARYRSGHTDTALRHFQLLKRRPMVHPIFYDLRRRFSHMARQDIALHDTALGDSAAAGNVAEPRNESEPGGTAVEQFLIDGVRQHGRLI